MIFDHDSAYKLTANLGGHYLSIRLCSLETRQTLINVAFLFPGDLKMK